MTELRHDWQQAEVREIFAQPLMDLLHQAQIVHRQHNDPNKVQISTLLNFKTGSCPEDCAYCPQSAHYDTGLQKESMMPVEQILAAAKKAKQAGATRFCTAAAWRKPNKKDFPQLVEMVEQIKALGLETCMSTGSLDAEQAGQLKLAGLDYYNHNLDTSPEYYDKIITTRPYQERLDTLQHCRDAGIHQCCGGIIGMGEGREDRIGLLLQLANLPEHPRSVTINKLIPVPGTPLAQQDEIDNIEFVRMIACARIMMPKSFVRLSAGRADMGEETQALCFYAGANSIHFGEKLLTTPNATPDADMAMMERLGLQPMEGSL